MDKIKVANGIYWVSIPDAGLYVLCGCPADSVKHLMKRGLIDSRHKGGVSWETGPNAILLSDVPIQKGSFSNLAEFPVLQMLYRQGMILPGHPNNTGRKPMLIGLPGQVLSQSEYIYRGNYGLLTMEEMMEAGMTEDLARETLRVKKRFAYDAVRKTEDLLDLRAMTGIAIPLAEGVFIHRKGLNLYEFISAGESVDVDLNLGPGEEYEPAYRLGWQRIEREYFSVIHTGEGDGWDVSRPCMAGVICHQGRLFLIDAGPHILDSLNALGITVNQVEGIFQTHSHDDHFAGLTSLILSDRRLAYYAVPFVRASVERKLSALMSLHAGEFSRYFDVRDLACGEWNDIQGLEARPVWSPHPVETTVFFFRALGQNGYRTYAHLADLASFDVLRAMSDDDPSHSGISSAAAGKYIDAILAPADVKKIDAGGGFVHGKAGDFRVDKSPRIILAHSAVAFTEKEKEIGSETSFGETEVLIPAPHDFFVYKTAFALLSAYFTGVPRHEIELLANCPHSRFSAGSILIRRGTVNDTLHLILGGSVEFIEADEGVRNRLSAGAFVGELSGITGEAARRTYRALSPLTTLEIPCALYRSFIARNSLHDTLLARREHRQFLMSTPLFGEMISFPVHHRIAQHMEKRTAEEGEDVGMAGRGLFAILESGEVCLCSAGKPFEIIGRGGFWGEEAIMRSAEGLFDTFARTRSAYYVIPLDVLEDVPIVQWKIAEAFRRRFLGFRSEFSFEWSEMYSTGSGKVDDQHRQLFDMIKSLAESPAAPGPDTDRISRIGDLIAFTRVHFETEENLMRERRYPEYESHRGEHAEFFRSVEMIGRRHSRSAETDAADFLKDWVINHTLMRDRKLKPYFVSRNA